MPDPMPPACLHPVPEDLWGRPALALHVQPHLEPAAQAALHALQGEVALLWPARLHRAPGAALHLTIYPLVPVRGAFDRDAYWAEIAAPALEVLRGLCAAAGPFRLRFERVRVTPAAIIAVARDGSGLIERIRRAVAETLPPPPGLAPMRYDLIHSTLAAPRGPGPDPGRCGRRPRGAAGCDRGAGRAAEDRPRDGLSVSRDARARELPPRRRRAPGLARRPPDH
jgi:hypothetical protein